MGYRCLQTKWVEIIFSLDLTTAEYLQLLSGAFKVTINVRSRLSFLVSKTTSLNDINIMASSEVGTISSVCPRFISMHGNTITKYISSTIRLQTTSSQTNSSLVQGLHAMGPPAKPFLLMSHNKLVK